MKKLLLLVCISIALLNQSVANNVALVAPTISNVSVTSITPTTATLNYTVNANGSNTTIYIQYNTTPTFTNFITGGNANGTNNTNLNYTLSGLTPCTTYYYQIDAYNAQNEGATPVTGTFTTGSIVPTLTGFPASNVTATTARLSCSVSTNGATTHVEYKYGLSMSALNNTIIENINHSNFPQPLLQDINGLTPNTTYYFTIVANNDYCAPTPEYSGSFTTLGSTQAPIISSISTSVNPYSATISYTLNANNSATTSVIKYGTSSSTLTNQVTGFNANGTTNVTNSVTLPNLNPNTTYFYRIEASNANGVDQSTIDSFTTLSPMAIAEYTFNSTQNDITGSNPFTSVPSTAYVNDRNGNANSALNINNSPIQATIPNLPYGNSARTIAFWAKTNVMYPDYNFTFSYGTAGNNNACGGSFNWTNVDFFGYGNNLTAATANYSNTWYFFTYTYDGSVAKIYKNGVLLTSQSKNWNTLNNNDLFKLGVGVGGETSNFNGAIDDLKIYNYVVSDAEISNLFTNNVLSASTFSSELSFSLYPNPATESFSIEMETELKSVEIYSLQGQKVLSSNAKNINVATLAKGIYLVRIEDENNTTATQKLIIK